jgi:hypothetical protein
MKNKRFSPSLKEKHDKVGKSLAVDIMRDVIGAQLITDNLKEDAGDFTDGFWDQKYRLPNGKEIKVEPEMKDEKWWGDQWSACRPFRYEEMDIPYRKAKNQAHLHIVISTCQKFAFLVSRDAMDKTLEESGGSPKIKRTIYEPQGAAYFSTPVNRGKFVQKREDGHWHFWKKN